MEGVRVVHGAVVETDNNRDGDRAAVYRQNHSRLREKHHARCLFNRTPSIFSGVSFTFNESGSLRGTFTCGEEHQGYDGIIHGGVLAAIIDASMAQCLMGNGIAAYTADLSVKYRKPALIGTPTHIRTSIHGVGAGILYKMRAELIQNDASIVTATARFYRFQ